MPPPTVKTQINSRSHRTLLVLAHLSHLSPLSHLSHLSHLSRLSRVYLEGEDRETLEAEVGLEVLSDLTHEALEGELAQEQLSALLVLADLTESDGAGAEAVRLLHASGGGGGLASCLGGELLARILQEREI